MTPDMPDARIEELEADLDAAEAERDSLQDKLTEVEGERDVLQGKVDALTETLEDIARVSTEALRKV